MIHVMKPGFLQGKPSAWPNEKPVRSITKKALVIPQSNPSVRHCGNIQKMILPDGRPKGLQQVLEERGFDVHNLRAKCTPVCPWESTNCCTAHLLSQQEDFMNQPSMLEILIKKAGYECIFLPKFHCELNPIEMVSEF